MKKGVFVVISGPSGVGKDTIASSLIERGNGIYSVSMTTRERRFYEVEGKDYFFRTKEEFEDNIRNGNMFEYATYNGNYYGTLKSFIFDNIDNGTNVISVIDIQGATTVEEIYPDAVLIFIMPPSFEELEKRLRDRESDSEDSINRRLEIAKKEITYRDKYDYVVINDDIDRCINEIENIIKKEETRVNKQFLFVYPQIC